MSQGTKSLKLLKQLLQLLACWTSAQSSTTVISALLETDCKWVCEGNPSSARKATALSGHREGTGLIGSLLTPKPLSFSRKLFPCTTTCSFYGLPLVNKEENVTQPLAARACISPEVAVTGGKCKELRLHAGLFVDDELTLSVPPPLQNCQVTHLWLRSSSLLMPGTKQLLQPLQMLQQPQVRMCNCLPPSPPSLPLLSPVSCLDPWDEWGGRVHYSIIWNSVSVGDHLGASCVTN